MVDEVLTTLSLQPNEHVVDGTVGAGGHAVAMLEKTSPHGKLLGLDLDEVALDTARKQLDRFGSRAMLVHTNYTEVERVLLSHSFGPVQAALLDLGFSSLEIDDPSRGLSFLHDGPLDMRFDRSQSLTAAEIVNQWPEHELAEIFRTLGEERYSARIAYGIVRSRKDHPLVGTLDLVTIIRGAVPSVATRSRLHFATRTFQALRIATNDELGNIRAGLDALMRVLAPGGRLAIISFHSLEDRIVKQFFLAQFAQGVGKILTKRPLTPSDTEIQKNPRSRSAKLRAFQTFQKI